MLKRYYLVIKLFLALYLVHICYLGICIFVYAYMYHEHMCIINLHVHGGAYVFSWFLVIWD